MKTTRLLVLLGALSLGACSADDRTVKPQSMSAECGLPTAGASRDQWNTLRNESLGFQLQYPNELVADPSKQNIFARGGSGSEDAIISVMSSTNTEFDPRWTRTRLKSGADVAYECVDGYIHVYARSGDRMVIFSARSDRDQAKSILGSLRIDSR